MKPVPTQHPEERNIRGYESDDPKIGLISDLPTVVTDGNHFWSRWRPDFWERVRLILGCDVWLDVITRQQPPVYLYAGEHPGFQVMNHEPHALHLKYCPTFEHWLECRLYRNLVRAAARIGFITVAEGSYLRLDRRTILREEDDGDLVYGPAFHRGRWRNGWDAFRLIFSGGVNCRHEDTNLKGRLQAMREMPG